MHFLSYYIPAQGFNVEGCGGGTECTYENGGEILEFYGVEDFSLYLWILIVYLFAAIFCVLTYMVFIYKYSRRAVNGTLDNLKSRESFAEKNIRKSMSLKASQASIWAAFEFHWVVIYLNLSISYLALSSLFI